MKLGANHWIPRLPRIKHRFQHGLAIGDLDQNGLEDLYLCQPEGLPNLLLLRQPDGSVREAAADYGLNFLDISTSALFADFDNDGDQDLVIAFRSPLDIFENVDGQFHRRHSIPSLGQIFNLAAADPDADGLFDLFICRYQNLDEKGQAPSAIPLHDAQNGGENILLKNPGDWKFSDVTARVGLDHNNNRWTVAAAWEDYDRDGDLDLYCANDYGRNNLYRCDTGPNGSISFTDVAPETGTEDMTTSMGVTWADLNHDGWDDLLVANGFITGRPPRHLSKKLQTHHRRIRRLARQSLATRRHGQLPLPAATRRHLPPRQQSSRHL
ncbi:VCBS repeat-containing protein [Verrucomicrobiaceae bacterium 227]